MRTGCDAFFCLAFKLPARLSLLVISACLTQVALGSETEFQLYKSADLGASWSQAGQGLPRDARINALSAVGDVTLAGTDRGIFISHDAGVKWQSAPKNGGAEFRVLCLTTIGERVFAGTEKHGVLVSNDRGVSWKSANNGLVDSYVRSLLAVETNLYAGTDKQGVFVSKDLGATWQQQKAGLPDLSQVFDLAAVSGSVFAGLYSKGLYRWEVGPGRWSKVGKVVPLELTTAGNILVVGHNPGGIFVSEDMGKSWQDGNLGLPRNAPTWTLAADKARVWVGTSGKIAPAPDNIGLFASDDGGKSWKQSDAGLPPSSAAISFLVTKEFILVGIIALKSEAKNSPN